VGSTDALRIEEQRDRVLGAEQEQGGIPRSIASVTASPSRERVPTGIVARIAQKSGGRRGAGDVRV